MSGFNYKIDIKDYKIESQIGNGAYGVIYMVKNQVTDKIYVAKVLSKIDPDDDAAQQSVKNEIKILKECHHPTLIEFRGFSKVDFYGHEKYTLLLDYCPNNSLKTMLHKVHRSTSTIKFTNTNRQIILIGIARGMLYLHNHRIIHRDLKPDNVLLDENLHPHITDFGLSQTFQSYEPVMSMSIGLGTPVYMAPELFEGGSYTSKVDVYSFAILMYEVLTGNEAYPGITGGVKLMNLVSEGFRPEFRGEIKPSLESLIRQCWSQEPDQRPTFEDIYNFLAYGSDLVFGDVEDKEKYFLDDVDKEEIDEYIKLIENDEISKEKNLKVIDDLTKKVDKMKEQMDDLKTKPSKRIVYENKIEELEDEIATMKKERDEQNLKIDKLLNEVSSMKKERSIMFDHLEERVRKRMNVIDDRFRIVISCLSEVTIPNDMVEIPKAAFLSCTRLKKVIISNSVVLIGHSAFAGCTELVDVVIPESVVLIDKYAFADCIALKRINIPSSVKMIGKSAFKGCKELEDVSIQPSTKIGNGVFNGCPKINNKKEKELKPRLHEEKHSPAKKRIRIVVPVTPVSVDSSICAHPKASRPFSAEKKVKK